jgi:hypothetical protein
MTLGALHDVVHAAFGWFDYRLSEFVSDGRNDGLSMDEDLEHRTPDRGHNSLHPRNPRNVACDPDAFDEPHDTSYHISLSMDQFL